MSPLPVVLAGLLAFAANSVYYDPRLFGRGIAGLDPSVPGGVRPTFRNVLYEAVRTLAVAWALAVLITTTGSPGDWRHAIFTGFVAWIAFSALTWCGAIVWQRVPWRVAAVQSGDMLLRTLLVSFIVGIWP